MAKNTSRKIKELKGIKPEKITDEQLTKVQSTIDAINRIQLELGSIEVQKHETLHRVSALRETLGILQKEFEKEYGTFDVDIQTGTINYKEDDKANKKD